MTHVWAEVGVSPPLTAQMSRSNSGLAVTFRGEPGAKIAVETAGKSLKDLRVAEVTKLDLTVEKGKVKTYRARINVSFKYMKGE